MRRKASSTSSYSSVKLPRHRMRLVVALERRHRSFSCRGPSERSREKRLKLSATPLSQRRWPEQLRHPVASMGLVRQALNVVPALPACRPDQTGSGRLLKTEKTGEEQAD